MAATNRYMNFSAAFTPSGGSSTPITGLKSVRYNDGFQTLKEKADFDIYDTVGGVVHANPTVTFRTIDAMGLYATLGGAVGTLVVTIRDFTNGATASGGAKTITMSNAFLAMRERDGEHQQLWTQQIMFESVSSDGATSTIATAAL